LPSANGHVAIGFVQRDGPAREEVCACPQPYGDSGLPQWRLSLLLLLLLLLLLPRPVRTGSGHSAVKSLKWVLDTPRAADSVTAAGRHEERYVGSGCRLGIDALCRHSAARGSEYCVNCADVAKPRVLQPVHHV
jgi:hypothetical protein